MNGTALNSCRGLWAGLLALLLVLGSPGAMAEGNQTVDRLLTVSGADGQMPTFDRMVQAMLAQNPGIADDDVPVLQHIAMETLVPGVIYEQVRAHVKEALKPGDVGTLLHWYESPLGQRITALEQAMGQSTDYAALKQAAPALMADSQRMQMAAKLDALVGVTALGLALQERAMLANHIAVQLSDDPQAPVSMAALDEEIAEHQVAMKQMMRQQSLLSLAYSYRELPLGKLASYQDFLATPVSQRYQSALQRGLLAGIDQVLDSWEADVRGYFRKDGE